MNRLQYKKGLLYVAIELKHNGKSVTIEDVIIDTGASHTIITAEYLEKMDILHMTSKTSLRHGGKYSGGR